jgi:hypothetical protein
MSLSPQGGIIYYARERYYQHIQTEVLELVKKYGADPTLTYWQAYSLVMSGKKMELISTPHTCTELACHTPLSDIDLHVHNCAHAMTRSIFPPESGGTRLACNSESVYVRTPPKRGVWSSKGFSLLNVLTLDTPLS